jgi:hypothetical protein
MICQLPIAPCPPSGANDPVGDDIILFHFVPCLFVLFLTSKDRMMIAIAAIDHFFLEMAQ